MKKLILKIDVSKIDKSKIVDRKFTNREGIEVVVKELTLELVELNAPKFVTEGQDWQMLKTHFIAEAQTKEQRAAKAKSKIIGDGLEFRQKANPAMGEVAQPLVDIKKDNTTSIGPNGEPPINLDDIPF